MSKQIIATIQKNDCLCQSEKVSAKLFDKTYQKNKELEVSIDEKNEIIKAFCQRVRLLETELNRVNLALSTEKIKTEELTNRLVKTTFENKRLKGA